MASTSDSNDHNSEDNEEILLRSVSYISQYSNPQMWEIILKGFNIWLNIPENKLKTIIEALQGLADSLLLLDDIQDDSDLRGGAPVANKVYGFAQSLNSANFNMCRVFQKLLTLSHDEIPVIFTDTMLDFFRGTGMEMFWRESLVCPTEEQYIAMAKKKLVFFLCGAKLLQVFSDNKCDLKPLCDNMAVYAQILDDYCNLKSSKMIFEKGYAEDLTEGKFSFPIIHGIRSHPENNPIMNILRQKTRKIDVKKYCVDYLESIGSFDYTLSFARDLATKIVKQVEELGGNVILIGFIKSLYHEYVDA